jgi:hypothetical protein
LGGLGWGGHGGGRGGADLASLSVFTARLSARLAH